MPWDDWQFWAASAAALVAVIAVVRPMLPRRGNRHAPTAARPRRAELTIGESGRRAP